jgi:hypothetical protein
MFMFAFDSDPNKGGKKYFLVFERAGGQARQLGSSPDLLRTNSNRSTISVNSVSDSICLDHVAQDMVTPLESGGLREDKIVIGSLQFTKKFPDLLDVVLLAGIIHTESPNYLLFSKNCFYFTGTMMAVLHKAYSRKLTMDDNAGKWHGINVNSPTGHTRSLCETRESDQELCKSLSILSNCLLNKDCRIRFLYCMTRSLNSEISLH